MQFVCYNCFHVIPSDGVCPLCGYDPSRDAKKYPFVLKPGSKLANRYLLGRILGQGGFGATYIALDHITKSRVAIKEYLPSELAMRNPGERTLIVYAEDMLPDFEYGKQQFLAEAQILSKFVGNEHIVGIQHYFEENGTAYYVMEYMEGVTLKQQLTETSKPLSVPDANRILLPIMEALDWVHSKGIIHRDIAPDNIMMRTDGTAKLIDFGAARNSTGEKSKSLDVILKHGYAPIEQYARRGRQGPYTDVYAMGATYYYAITGKVPPDAIERSDVDELIPPSRLGVKIPAQTEEVLLKALAVNAPDRYQTMADFYHAMMESMSSSADSASAARRTVITTDMGQALKRDSDAKKKKRRLIGVFAAAGVLAAALLAFFLLGNRTPPNPAIASPPVETAVPETPEPTPSPTPAPTPVPTPAPEASAEPLEPVAEEPTPVQGIALVSGDDYSPGSIVRFGSYEQDNNEENGPEALEWLILDAKDNTRMLISRNAIECQPFNVGGNAASVVWETSTLRSWLNSDFLETAFVPEDRDAILVTTVDNNHRQAVREYFITDSPDTEDRLYLLSYAEAWNYFKTDWERSCLTTRYASSLGLYVNKDTQTSPWWLRSPGERKGDASFIYMDGTLGNGHVNESVNIGTRPVMWIDLDILGVSPSPDTDAEPDPGQDPAGEESPGTTDLPQEEPAFGSVGTTVSYGHYEQDGDPDNGKEEIEWLVLDADGDRRLLISKYGLCRHTYHPYTDEVFWETSAIRKWLNSEFFSEAFSSEEQANILDTVLDNSSAQCFNQDDDGRKTVDKLFFLSFVEAEKYFPTAESRVCENTPFAVSQKPSRDEYWWLRVPGRRLQFVDCIAKNGAVKEIMLANNEVFVRPAMWIELRALQGEPANQKTTDPWEFREVGNVVRFGQYEQDNNEANGRENIEWIVLDCSGDQCLLISRCGLDKIPFHNSMVETGWKDSDLRAWLNGDFYEAAFSADEQDAIVLTDVDNSWNQWAGRSREGNNTEDRVFLLSYLEAWSYFWTDYERTCAPTAYANAKAPANQHEWWLRSPGRTHFNSDYVTETGAHDEMPAIKKTVLVRPVMIVDLNSPIFRN